MITFILLSFLMVLDKNRISSLHGQINSLEVQKGMKDTVIAIENDIFNLFANTEIITTDKQKVSKLESALFSRITSLEKNQGKKSQEMLQKLSVQKDLLTRIRNSIDQVNSPSGIEKTVLAARQTNIQLLQSNVVTDYNAASARISNIGKCTINDKVSTITINSVNENNAIHRQLEYQNKIFGHIKKSADGWTFIPNPHIESIGITNIKIPFVVQKDIYVVDPDTGKKFTSIVTKKKPWIIDTKQWIANANSTENTNGSSNGGSNTQQNNQNNTSGTQPGSQSNQQSEPETIDIEHEEINEPGSSNTNTPPETNITNPGTNSKTKKDPDIEDVEYEDITDQDTTNNGTSTTPSSPQAVHKQLDAGPKQLLLPPHTGSDAIEKIDMTMEQLMQIVKLSDMRNHYNQLAGRRQTLKKHMQDFDQDGSINADTPLFRSIFPALEHEINEFKKGLTNAIADTQEKIDLIDNSGLTDLDAVKQLAQQVRDIQTAYNTINNDFALVHKDLLDRIYKKTPKQLPPHTPDGGGNTGGETPLDDNNDSAPTQVEDYASISNVTNISRQEAERQAEEIMRERIQNMAWYNPDRIRHFAMRSFIKQAEIDKIINKKQGFHREDDKTKATERHQLQYETAMDDIDMVELIDESTYPRAHQQINTLVAQYVDTPNFTNTMTDGQFEQKFQAIIMARPPLDNRQPSLRDLMKQNNMDQVSSNILYRTKMFKDHQVLVGAVYKEITDANVQGIADDQFANRCRPHIMSYVSKYNKIPDFMKLQHVNLNLDDAQLYNKLRRYGAHQYGLQTIAAQSLNLKVKILNKGRAAHEITNQDHGIITKAGKFWDGDWIAHSERMRKHPKLKEALGWLRGGTKVAGTVGVALGVGAIANPLAAALVMGGTVGLRTLISKFSHYTKEYEGQLRNHAIDSTNYNAERDRLHDMVENGELQRWHKYLPTKKGHERRHRERYINTTQSNVLLSKDIAATIRRYTTNANPLTQAELDQLRTAAGDALARLDYYRDVGQNFTGTDQYTQAEKDYHDLYQTVLGSLQRLGTDLGTLRQDPAYTTSHDIIEQQYQETFRNFKSKRRKLGRHRAIARGLLTGGLTYASKLAQAASTKVTTSTEETEILNNSNNWKLAKHGNIETMSGASIDTAFPMVGNPATIPANSDIGIVIDVGTDAVPVRSAATYATELANYKARIASMTAGLHPDTALEINRLVAPGPLQHPAFTFIDGAWGADTGNALLAKCRYMRGVEEYLQELVTNPNAATIKASFSTTASSPGVVLDNAAERFFNVKSYLIETTEHTSQSRGGYGIPGNIADNTFKRREGNVGSGYMTDNPNRPQRRPQNPSTPVPPTPRNP